MSTHDSKIITFYSYKGGVGRSMALANVAWLLASKYRKKVLAIDWDLEAPGLHRFFNVQEENIKKGLIDLFYDYKDLLKKDAFSLDEGLIKINRYIIKVPEKTKIGGSILFMPSGKQDKGYAKRVNEFGWQDFYTKWHGFGFIEYLKDQFKKNADIVLIDSRTGVTDSGGICTMQLPEVVVLLFSLNEQNLAGTKMIIESISKKSTKVKDQKKPPKLVLIPSRVERYLEQEAKYDWEERAAERLGEYLPEKEKKRAFKYMKKKSIPYVGYFSFGEMLAVKKDPDGELAGSLDDLTVSALEAAGLWEEKMEIAPEPVRADIRYALKGYGFKRRIISMFIIIALTFSVVISYQLFFKKRPIDNSVTLIDLGNSFLDIAGDRDNIRDKEEYLNKAIQQFNNALDRLNVKKNPHSYAKAHNGLGNAYRDFAGIRDKGENLNRAIQSFNEALPIFTVDDDPIYYVQAHNGLGNTYRDLAGVRDKEENLFKAIDTFERALTVKEDPFWYAKTQNDLGNAYRDLSLAQNNKEPLKRAIQSYNRALGIFNAKEYPSYHEEVSLNLDRAISMQRIIQKKKPYQKQIK